MANEPVNNMISTQRANRAGVSTMLAYLLIGGGIGAILALLFAPKSGRELRDDLADMVRGDSDYSSDAALQIEAGASEYYEAERESTSELYAAAAKQADSLANGV